MDKYAVKAVIVCGLAVLTCAAGWLGQLDETVAASVPVQLAPVVIVDAGHGGFDGGAVGVGGIVEKELNLAISMRLADMLEVAGYNVMLTRDQDEALGDDSGGSHKKAADIKYRLGLLESTPDSVLVSIHQNIFGGKALGAQVFYGPKNDDSAALAGIIQADFKSMLQPENHRETKQATDDIYLLYHATRPAVMVECGFISNAGEAEKLRTPEYQNKISFVITAALAEYLAA